MNRLEDTVIGFGHKCESRGVTKTPRLEINRRVLADANVVSDSGDSGIEPGPKRVRYRRVARR